MLPGLSTGCLRRPKSLQDHRPDCHRCLPSGRKQKRREDLMCVCRDAKSWEKYSNPGSNRLQQWQDSSKHIYSTCLPAIARVLRPSLQICPQYISDLYTSYSVATLAHVLRNRLLGGSVRCEVSTHYNRRPRSLLANCSSSQEFSHIISSTQKIK